MAKKSFKNKLLTLENAFGLLLAFLIVFDIKAEKGIANLVNSPLGMVMSLIIMIVVFVSMNPIVGLLYVIYLYETVKYSSTLLGDLVKPVEKMRKDVMNKLNNNNMLQEKGVEVEVIRKMAPLVKSPEDASARFQPNTLVNATYSVL